MINHAAALFDITGWDETAYDAFDGGRKLTRAHVTKTFQGAISGTSTVDYLMCYSADGSAQIVGLERLTGQIDDRSGSLVLQHTGTFQDGIVTIHLMVVPGSGTQELQGVTGEGGFSVGQTAPFPITLDYRFVAV